MLMMTTTHGWSSVTVVEHEVKHLSEIAVAVCVCRPVVGVVLYRVRHDAHRRVGKYRLQHVRAEGGIAQVRLTYEIVEVERLPCVWVEVVSADLT